MKKKLGFSFCIFFLSLGLTIWWVRQTEAYQGADFSGIKPSLLVSGLLLSLVIYITDAARYKVLLRSLGESTSSKNALEFSIVNFFFGWTTPGAIMAAPMTAYFMVKRGIRFDTAVLSSFGKSLIGMFYLLFASIVTIYSSRLYQHFDARIFYTLLSSFFSFFLFLFFLMILGLNYRLLEKFSFLPQKIKDVIFKLHLLFGKRSWENFKWISLSQLIYFCSLMGLSVFVISNFAQLDWLLLLALSSLFITLIYMSPTPGGVGLGEVLGIPILGKFMSLPNALLATFLVRFFIVYLPILIGTVYLMAVFAINYIALKKKL